jgi:hypothetical protein
MWSGTQKRKIANARKIFWQWVAEKMGYLGAEVARYLGVTTSSVNRLAVSEETADLKIS